MSIHDAHFPWIFHRDEVDLLEDELEDLYTKFGSASGEAPRSQEECILQEQMDTEDQSEAELTLMQGIDRLHNRHPEPSVLEEEEHDETLEEACVSRLRQNPLFQRSRVWAVELGSLTKAGYDRGGSEAGAYFRVYANVNLVPIKVFAALAEVMHEDPMGSIMAEQAFMLALTYLQRIRESLAQILHSAEIYDLLKLLHRQSELIEQGVQQELRLLRERRGLM
jgi:hypothetical protein